MPKNLPKNTKNKAHVMSVWQLTKSSARIIWDNRVVFVGIALIYGILILVLAKGFAGGQNVGDLKKAVSDSLSGNGKEIGASVAVFVSMIGSAGSGTTDTSGAYQLLVTVNTSLAIIWALRQILANKPFIFKEVYYKSMYPLIPFFIILAVVSLQLIPILLGSVLYSLVSSYGIAVSAIESILWILIFISLAALSLYFVCSSLLAVYIVTLPDMTPKKALATAKELVKGRRWLVVRKIISLPIVLFIISAIVMLPIILIAAPLAQLVFYLLTVLSLVAVHTYMYLLYRNLMDA